MKTIIGNLLSCETGILVHGVNCQGKMGSGIALQFKNMYDAKVICFSKKVGQPIFGYVKGVTRKPFSIDPVLIVVDPSRRFTAQIEADDIVHVYSNELAKAILTMDSYQTWLCHHAIGSREDFMSGKDQYKFLKEYKFLSDDFVINFETPEQAFLRGERVGAAAAAKEFTATSKKKPSARNVEDIVPFTNTTVANSRKLNKANKLIGKNVVAFQKGKLNGIGGSIELNETSLNAMVREFEEETSVFIPDSKWSYSGYLNDTVLNGAKVDVYFTILSENDYQQLKHVELQNLKLSKNEPLRFINVFYELILLNNRNILMYNIKDIIYKLYNENVSKTNLNPEYPYSGLIPLTWNYTERLQS